MKLLSLLRHATARIEGSGDHARPLTSAGQREAVDIAHQLAVSGLPAPDLILSSDALRTRDTAKAVAMLYPAAQLEHTAALYLASADCLLDTIQAQDDSYAHMLVVAHNPGVMQLAFDLDGGTHAAIARGFAPATLATFECTVGAWSDLRPTHAILKNVIVP